MCGIVGAIGRVRPSTIAELALACQSRGRDSSGLIWQGKKKVWYVKSPSSMNKLLNSKVGIKYLREMSEAPWWVSHCRNATTGSITARNAHPFYKEGNGNRWVLGVHNGIIGNWYKFNTEDTEVDSEVFFQLVANGKTEDIQKLSGWAACVWWDSHSGLHTYAHGAPLKCFRTRRALFMMSESNWLKRTWRPVFGDDGQLPEDKVFKWDIVNRRPIFVSKAKMEQSSWSKFWTSGSRYAQYLATSKSRHKTKILEDKTDPTTSVIQYVQCYKCNRWIPETKTVYLYAHHGDVYCTECAAEIRWQGAWKETGPIPELDEVVCEICNDKVKRVDSNRVDDLTMCLSCLTKFYTFDESQNNFAGP